MMSDSTDSRKLELLEIDDMMSRDNGRGFLRRILEHSGYFRDTYDSDACDHAQAAGARGEGVWLYKEIAEASPVHLLTLIKEHTENG